MSVLDPQEIMGKYPMVKVLQLNPQMKSVMTHIRNRETTRLDFVFFADRIVRHVVEEGLAELPYVEQTIVTPTGAEYHGLAFPKDICGVSIVRAGESMELALQQCCRAARIGKILIQRDEATAMPKLYYQKLPQDIAKRHVLLLDPMLATGGSAMQAIQVLEDAGVPQESIIFLNIVSCPEGLEALTSSKPKVRIVTAEVDQRLNEVKYIIPGIGDFGDRYFGTDN